MTRIDVAALTVLKFAEPSRWGVSYNWVRAATPHLSEVDGDAMLCARGR